MRYRRPATKPKPIATAAGHRDRMQAAIVAVSFAISAAAIAASLPNASSDEKRRKYGSAYTGQIWLDEILDGT